MWTHCDKLCAYHCINSTSLKDTDSFHTILKCWTVMCNLVFNGTHGEAFVNELNQEFQSVDDPFENHTICARHQTPLRLDLEEPVRYSVPIQGYISPILVFLTVINNSLVCIVLLKPHMRSPTNAILVAMALSDMFTGLFPLPVYLYFYSTNRYYEWIPYDWCLAIGFFRMHIPTIFHTASIWLTMALAIQRYIYVCHSFKARTWCTIRNVVVGTIAIYLIAILSQVSRFIESYPLEAIRYSQLEPNETMSACILEYRPWVNEYINLYFSTYYWFRVIFIHLIPCVSLVVMNALLIYAMKKAQQRRMQLLRQNKKSESRKLKESNCTTLMLVAVVGLFLLVEFPLGLLMVFMIIQQTFGVVIIGTDTIKISSLFANFFILLSYPLNFFIYCGMSKQFRETFKRLFTGAAMPMEREYSQYMTLPTENGKSTAVTGDETAL